MDKQNAEKLAEAAEKKRLRREKKRRGKMKISGAGVKRLAQIISKDYNVKIKNQKSK